MAEEVSSTSGSPRGERRGDAEGLCSAPKDTTKGQGGAPHLPPSGSASRRCHPHIPSPCTRLGAALLVGCPRVPSAVGPPLPKGLVHELRSRSSNRSWLEKEEKSKALQQPTQERGSSLYLRSALLQVGVKATPFP